MSNIQIPDNMEEVLDRLGACGMGYPGLGLPCIRPKDHNPFHDCFAILEKPDGKVWGVYMQQDGKDWTDDRTEWPTDLVISTPLFKERSAYAATNAVRTATAETDKSSLPDRRGLVAHTKGKSCNP